MAGRNHDLIGRESACSKVEEEAPVCGRDRLDRAVQLDRQFEGRRVAFEIANDLLPPGDPSGSPGTEDQEGCRSDAA